MEFINLSTLFIFNIVTLIALIIVIIYNIKSSKKISRIDTNFTSIINQLQKELYEFHLINNQKITEKISSGQLATQSLVSDVVHKHMRDVREQIAHSFTNHAESLTKHLQSLTSEIRTHLNSLSQQVNTRLTEGFEKTSTTFIDIVKRLTIIDEAQKKITELSQHVVSLQDILVDKKARGAFGEVQLNALIANVMPQSNYSLQYTLSNQKRADCILFLPEPTGNLVIDAKFPLETFQKLHGNNEVHNRKSLEQQFRQDLQKHIKDIAEKYIIPNETADGAIMFIPAESIFSEIHANYPDIIAMSQKTKVWLVSPSTLMAVLTTARAVIKDDATRKQIHIIQKHLKALADDFKRFEIRMDKLNKHIDLAHQDVNEVNTSAKKISQRFQRIESVQLDDETLNLIE